MVSCKGLWKPPSVCNVAFGCALIVHPADTTGYGCSIATENGASVTHQHAQQKQSDLQVQSAGPALLWHWASYQSRLAL